MITPQKNPLRIGAVSYLNTLPLIDGIECNRNVEVVLDVPARLAGRLVEGETDLSLCSVIDHQHQDAELALVPVGFLGCDGPTLTVGLFSSCPINEVRRVACDIDSHTSVMLLRIILKQVHGIEPELVPFDSNEEVEFPEAVLLIGDKVVHSAPAEETHPHRVDLGEAWKDLTGMPFVFGAWFCLADADEAKQERIRQLALLLDHRRRHNRGRIESIIAREATSRDWDPIWARRYLRELLRFTPTPEAVEAIQEFHRRAHEVGALARLRPLRIMEFC